MLKHKGEKYICPICGYQSKDWGLTGIDIPVIREKEIIGAGKRHASCHSCNSLDRDRLVYVFLWNHYKLLDRNRDLKILHIAPERSISEKIRAEHFNNYVCGDLFMPGYTYPEYTVNTNILDLQYEDDSLDLIICNHVLEHINDDAKAMSEIYRVLKPGGMALLQVPISKQLEVSLEGLEANTDEDRERLYGQFDHVRIYGKDYCSRLEAVGFKSEVLNIAHQYPKFGLNPLEDIYTFHKL